MSTPDELATAPSTQIWKGAPLPEIGCTITALHKVTTANVTRWPRTTGVVHMVTVHGDQLKLSLWLGSQGVSPDISLDGKSLLDRWESAPDISAEHEYRKATDEVYRHHSDTLDERMGLAKLKADDERRAFEAGEPAAVREMVERWGVKLADLTDVQRAAYVPSTPAAPEEATEEPHPDAYPESLSGKHRRLLYLKGEIASLEATISTLKGEYSDLNAALVIQLAEEGQTSQTVDGMTGYLAPKTYVTKTPGTDTDDVLTALRASGLEHMVIETFSASALKALLTECEKGAAEVPTALAKVVTLGRHYEVRFVKGATKKTAVTPADVLATSATS